MILEFSRFVTTKDFTPVNIKIILLSVDQLSQMKINFCGFSCESDTNIISSANPKTATRVEPIKAPNFEL